jgi:hypothetical protein
MNLDEDRKTQYQYWTWEPSQKFKELHRGLFPPGLQRPGREADHSPPDSAEVKKMWIYTSTPLYVFMA